MAVLGFLFILIASVIADSNSTVDGNATITEGLNVTGLCYFQTVKYLLQDPTAPDIYPHKVIQT